MTARKIIMTLALFVVAAAPCFASAAETTVWKLNEAKSTLVPGRAKNNIVTYSVEGEKVKIVIDGVSADGKPTHNEWKGKFDGKDYPVTGDPKTDVRSYRISGDRSLELTAKKGGKTTASGRVTISRDSTTRTVDLSITGADGKTVKSIAVYDRQ